MFYFSPGKSAYTLFNLPAINLPRRYRPYPGHYSREAKLSGQLNIQPELGAINIGLNLETLDNWYFSINNSYKQKQTCSPPEIWHKAILRQSNP